MSSNYIDVVMCVVSLHPNPLECPTLIMDKFSPLTLFVSEHDLYVHYVGPQIEAFEFDLSIGQEKTFFEAACSLIACLID